jgi:hypothetical protein
MRIHIFTQVTFSTLPHLKRVAVLPRTGLGGSVASRQSAPIRWGVPSLCGVTPACRFPGTYESE